MQFVTYHYVRPRMDVPPYGYYHLPLTDFRAQLDHFEERYTVLDRKTTLEILQRSTTPPGDGIVLTFDDGLRDHAEWVLPELEDRGLWGIFFVPVGPYLDGTLLDVHRIHVLAGRYRGKTLLDELESIVEDRSMTEEETHDSNLLYGGRDDGPLPRFKRILNEQLSNIERRELLSELERRLPDSPDVNVDEYYLSRDELTELIEKGMTLGGHSKTHRILAQLETNEQRTEIHDSVEFFTQLDVEPPWLFAYPYGSNATFAEETISLLRAAGFEAAFTTISDTVDGRTVSQQHMALPRRDCTEFPHGSSRSDLP